VKDLPEEIHNAVIAAEGKLTPNYNYIANLRVLNQRADKQHEFSDGSSIGAQ
jgi:hypothetical protein